MNHRQPASAIVNPVPGAAGVRAIAMEDHEPAGGSDSCLLPWRMSQERLFVIDPEQRNETFQPPGGMPPDSMIRAMDLQARHSRRGLYRF